MKTKEINVKPIISHFLPLEKGPETFDKLVNKKERFDSLNVDDLLVCTFEDENAGIVIAMKVRMPSGLQ